MARFVIDLDTDDPRLAALAGLAPGSTVPNDVVEVVLEVAADVAARGLQGLNVQRGMDRTEPLGPPSPAPGRPSWPGQYGAEPDAGERSATGQPPGSLDEGDPY